MRRRIGSDPIGLTLAFSCERCLQAERAADSGRITTAINVFVVEFNETFSAVAATSRSLQYKRKPSPTRRNFLSLPLYQPWCKRFFAKTNKNEECLGAVAFQPPGYIRPRTRDSEPEYSASKIPLWRLYTDNALRKLYLDNISQV